jgi:hypothetical protein
LRYELKDDQLKKRIEKALDKCIDKIQKTQSDNGAWQDGGLGTRFTICFGKTMHLKVRKILEDMLIQIN